MGGCLRIGIPIIILIALAIYCAFPHPTHNQAQLRAIAAESQHLIATYPLGGSERYADIPKGKWPPAIPKLKPYSVTVFPGTVDITTQPFFDGGWGYGFALNKQDLTMLVECWSELGHDVYWHGPC
jgi:hypothetical protein